jgi:hypothetical protein
MAVLEVPEFLLVVPKGKRVSPEEARQHLLNLLSKAASRWDRGPGSRKPGINLGLDQGEAAGMPEEPEDLARYLLELPRLQPSLREFLSQFPKLPNSPMSPKEAERANRGLGLGDLLQRLNSLG